MAEILNPGALTGANIGRECLATAGGPEKDCGRSRAATWLRIDNREVFHTVALNGQVKLILLKVFAAGQQGATLHDFLVSARLAQYVWKLRVASLPIGTEMEAHGGELPGVHANCRPVPGVRMRAEAGQ